MPVISLEVLRFEPGAAAAESLPPGTEERFYSFGGALIAAGEPDSPLDPNLELIEDEIFQGGSLRVMLEARAPLTTWSGILTEMGKLYVSDGYVSEMVYSRKRKLFTLSGLATPLDTTDEPLLSIGRDRALHTRDVGSMLAVGQAALILGPR